MNVHLSPTKTKKGSDSRSNWFQDLPEKFRTFYRIIFCAFWIIDVDLELFVRSIIVAISVVVDHNLLGSFSNVMWNARIESFEVRKPGFHLLKRELER